MDIKEKLLAAGGRIWNKKGQILITTIPVTFATLLLTASAGQTVRDVNC